MAAVGKAQMMEMTFVLGERSLKRTEVEGDSFS